MFLTEPDQTEFTVANVQARAIRFNQDSDPNVHLGLYLCSEFGWLAGWGGNIEKYQITNLRISDRIVTLKDFDKLWDEQIELRTHTELRTPKVGPGHELQKK